MKKQIFFFDSFYKNLLIYLFIALTLFLVLEPFETSLFSGSAWRNTQTYAAYPCFQDAETMRDIVKCFFAPKLGFNDSHYAGLELSVLAFTDYLLGSEVTVYSVKSKAQLLAAILIIMPVLVFIRRTYLSFFIIALYVVSLLDNPTLNFFLLSYQPDLLSMGMMFTGFALLFMDKKSVSYIPEFIIGLSLMIKPQHGLICLTGVLFFRYLANRYEKKVLIKLFVRSVITCLPVLFYVVSGKVAISTGLGVKYPALTHILGFGNFSISVVMNYYLQMFPRNGYEYLIIVASLFLLIVFILNRDKAALFRIIFLMLSLAAAYTITYCIFAIGFIVNIYYGSVLFITINLFVIYLLHLFSNIESEFDIVSSSNKILLAVMAVIIIVSAAGLTRKKEFYAGILTNRKIVCNPADIRPFTDKHKDSILFINNIAFEPTARTAAGAGENLWFTALSKKYADVYKNEIKQGKDMYFLSCSYFTDMIHNDKNTSAFLEKTLMKFIKKANG